MENENIKKELKECYILCLENLIKDVRDEHNIGGYFKSTKRLSIICQNMAEIIYDAESIL